MQNFRQSEVSHTDRKHVIEVSFVLLRVQSREKPFKSYQEYKIGLIDLFEVFTPQ